MKTCILSIDDVHVYEIVDNVQTIIKFLKISNFFSESSEKAEIVYDFRLRLVAFYSNS